MKQSYLIGAVVVIALIAMVAFGQKKQPASSGLSGTIEVDGSSTVFPITEAVAEEFRKQSPGVQINIGVSGTGGGFKRFTVGETQISNASRPIKEKESDAAKAKSIAFTEFTVALDGISIVANKSNTFLDCLTVAELKKIWEPESKVTNWSDVRAGLPANKIKLYGPGTDSGTFDYFTEAINGKEKSSRADFTASEDDNVLVKGVSGDADSLGYFGYAYYAENSDQLKLISVDNGNGCIKPSTTAIEDGSYKPLSRPIFIYVNDEALKRPEVAAFVRFYLENSAKLSAEVGYVPLGEGAQKEQLNKLDSVLGRVK